MGQKVDSFFERENKWKEEFTELRSVISECGLSEQLKWGQACYCLGKSNIVLIHGFKEYCALLFFKGALLQDTAGILIRQTENVQAARQARFTNIQEIRKLKQVLKAYVLEAVEVEKAGLKVALKKMEDYHVPEEFQLCLDRDPVLKQAFEALTPGRRRAYLFFFAQPKLPKTRTARIAKCLPEIIKGKGLND